MKKITNITFIIAISLAIVPALSQAQGCGPDVACASGERCMHHIVFFPERNDGVCIKNGGIWSIRGASHFINAIVTAAHNALSITPIAAPVYTPPTQVAMPMPTGPVYLVPTADPLMYPCTTAANNTNPRIASGNSCAYPRECNAYDEDKTGVTKFDSQACKDKLKLIDVSKC